MKVRPMEETTSQTASTQAPSEQLQKKEEKSEIEQILERTSLSPMEIQIHVENFIDVYFQETEKIVSFNVTFLEDNEFIEPELDYTKLMRFINTAINNIQEMAPSVIDDLVGKLRNDVKAISTFRHEFSARNKVGKAVYKRDFLGNLAPYAELEREVEKAEAFKGKYESVISKTDAELQALGTPKDTDAIRTHKILKKKNIDAIHHLAQEKEKIAALSQAKIEMEKNCEEEFFGQFESKKQYYEAALHSITNTKTFYLDKIFWLRAEDAETVKRFFKESRITDPIGLKAYIKYYLQGIDISSSGNAEWHAYLQECLNMMD